MKTEYQGTYGDANSGTRSSEYDTLVFLGIAERRTEQLADGSGRPAGSRTEFRLAQEVRS
jgi:hypothetical protein